MVLERIRTHYIQVSGKCQLHFKKYRLLIFRLATETACVLNWLTVVTINGVMAMKIKHFADKVPAFVQYLRTFGEAGVVTIAGTVKVKVSCV
jgi:hypothetical protein